MFFHIVPPEGNFDIGATEGVGGGDHSGPQNLQKSQKIARTKIVHTSMTFFSKSVQRYI